MLRCIRNPPYLNAQISGTIEMLVSPTMNCEFCKFKTSLKNVWKTDSPEIRKQVRPLDTNDPLLGSQVFARPTFDIQ